MKKSFVFFALFSLLLTACGTNSDVPNTIKVSGSHKEIIKPDLYKCHLFIKQTAVEKEVAIKNLEQTRAELYQIVKKANFPDSSIKANSISVRKQQKWENGVTETIGFMATQELFVKIPNAPSALIQAMHKISDLEIERIEPSFSNPENIRNMLLAKATQNALTKASTIANSFGAKIGNPINISEESFHEPAMRTFALTKNDFVSGANSLGDDFSKNIEMEASVLVIVELKNPSFLSSINISSTPKSRGEQHPTKARGLDPDKLKILEQMGYGNGNK
ncbi:MAG: SIMPL domain-containing protein [Fibrobacteraceae bacterium]|nr:SIMPL domain-containing protein [Fibrobacteraceae bacterium]